MVAPNLARYLRLSDLAIVEKPFAQNKAYPALAIVGMMAHWYNVRPGIQTRPNLRSLLSVPLQRLVAATFSSRQDFVRPNLESAEISLNFYVEKIFPQLQLKPQVSDVVLSADPAPVADTPGPFMVTMVSDRKEILTFGGEEFCAWYRADGTLRAIAWRKYMAEDENLQVL